MRIFMTFLTVSALLFLIPLPLSAQPPEDFLEANASLLEELRSLAANPNSTTSDQTAQRIADLFSSLILRVIQHEFLREDRDRVQHVEIKVVENAENCATIDGVMIFLSDECFEEAFQVALWLSHDIMIQQFGPLEFPEPIFTNPFSKSELLPIIRPLPGYAETMDWRFLTCPTGTDCRFFQSIQTFATFGFIIAHEISHFLLDHDRQKSYSVGNEIAADFRAREILKVLEEDSLTGSEDWDHSIGLAFAAAPLVLLDYQIEKSQQQLLQQSLTLRSADRVDESEIETRIAFRHQRQAALKATIPEHLLEDVELLTEPDRDDRNTGELIIRSPIVPNLLLVDGLTIPFSEVAGKPLLVSSGRHHVLARHGNELAYARVYVGGWAEELDLEFHPLASDFDPEAIARYDQQRAWFDLLLHSSDRDFRPREPAIARLHMKALQRMGMASLVRTDISDLSSEDRRYISWLKSRGKALYGWGLPPAAEPSEPTTPITTQAPGRDRAELQAKEFLRRFGLGKHRLNYRRYLASKYRDSLPEDAFFHQYSLILTQLGGGGSNRRLIEEHPIDVLKTPLGPIHGSFYFFKYKTRYPAGSFFEAITLEDEGGGEWRVVSCFLVPTLD